MSTKKEGSRFCSTRSHFCITPRYSFIIAIVGLIALQIFLGSRIDFNGYSSQTTKQSLGIAATKFNQRGHRKYVVWMFPFPPLSLSTTEIVLPKLICAYSNACKDFKDHAKINLRELTQGTYYQNYIHDQAYHKVRHMNDFPYHIQAITMLALLLDNSDQGEFLVPFRVTFVNK